MSLFKWLTMSKKNYAIYTYNKERIRGINSAKEIIAKGDVEDIKRQLDISVGALNQDGFDRGWQETLYNWLKDNKHLTKEDLS